MKTKSFAQTLLAWRRKQKLSRADMCRLMRIPYRTWQDWELGTHTPNPFVQAAVISRIKMLGISHAIRVKNARKIEKLFKGVKPYTPEELMAVPR